MPIEILMPALSPTMTEGNLAKWNKKEGDTVKAGDVIAEIETDKATMEVEAVDEGTLGKILVKEGTQDVPVNKAIALLLEDGEDKKVLEDYKPKEDAPTGDKKEEVGSQESGVGSKEEKKSPPTTDYRPQTTATKAPDAPIVKGDKGRVKASPVARRMAEQAGFDVGVVTGSGPGGRIVKEDVERHLAGGGILHRNPVEFVKSPNDTMRKVIAKRLLESKQTVPHFYLTIECQLDKLLDVRKDLNAKGASREIDGKPAYKLSVNDFIIKASAMAMRDVPGANSSWYDDAIVLYNNIDISVAVATEGGLITPIIRNADQKSLPQISGEMKELAARARKNALKPEEFQGGGFSISNLGMYGVKEFAAIINPPQSCILAVGAGEERVVVRNGQIVPATVMNATLSVDHRSVDGALGAQWLAAFKRYIESPVTMFV